MKRKFDGTFEGAAFEGDPGLLNGLFAQLNPEVLKAFRVIIDALLEEHAKPRAKKTTRAAPKPKTKRKAKRK